MPILCLPALFAIPVHSASACKEGSLTELEQVYCKIKSKGKGRNLPNFEEFRRNPPSTQALLLKQPARKSGISMPGAKQNAQSAFARKPVIQSQALQPTPAPRVEKVERESPPSSTLNIAQNCLLQREIIRCGGRRFELQTNLNNTSLPARALTSSNTLRLPDRQSSTFNNASKHYYLSRAYVSYIEKMLLIGLGDATMSFTKFAATYDDIRKQGHNFSQRFEKMYELLKNERKTNAVKSRYSNLFPTKIEQCMELSSKLIVCDNVKQNWVYRAP